MCASGFGGFYSYILLLQQPAPPVLGPVLRASIDSVILLCMKIQCVAISIARGFSDLIPFGVLCSRSAIVVG